MKNTLLITIVLLIINGCGAPDKNAKLEDLKKKRDELNVQIEKLEKEAGPSEDKTERVKNVAVTEISPAPFAHYIEIQGKVDSDENLTLTSKTMGVVTSIKVKVGDTVKKGQVLAELDNQVMVQGLSELQTQIQFANNLYQKQKNLWEQKIGTEVQYLTAKNNKEALENKLVTMQQQIDMTRIKSPIDGTVDEIMLKLGQNAAPGVPAVRVVNATHLKIKADLAESYASKVKKGNDVIVSFPDLNKEIKSNITFSGSVINPLTRSFTVEAALPDNKLELRPNMVAVLKIADYKAEDAITIPVNALQSSEEGSYVYIASNKGGKLIAEKAIVETGLTYNNQVEIKSGLKPGDKVVTTGYQDLNKGELIKF
jgi:RND family efflux transporter MFP subunit